MKDILKECPFCGNDKIAVIEYEPQENESFKYFSKRYAICCKYSGDIKGCGAESGHFKIFNEAVDHWNARTQRG